jgi:hypothetical protein
MSETSILTTWCSCMVTATTPFTEHGANDANAAHSSARILKCGVTGNWYAPFGGGAGVGGRPSDHNLARLFDYSGKLYKVYV